MAASEGAKEAIYLQNFLTELGDMSSNASPTPMSVDNRAAQDLSYNPEHRARTEHIARRRIPADITLCTSESSLWKSVSLL